MREDYTAENNPVNEGAGVCVECKKKTSKMKF